LQGTGQFGSNADEESEASESSVKTKWIDILVDATYLGFLAAAIVLGPHTVLAYIALGLSVGCAVLWFIARRQLGEAFSVTAQAHHLVTQGLYSRIRHPVYTFGTLAFLWIVLAVLGWGALVWWAVVIAIQVSRIRREERVLAQAFGEAYQAYRRHTLF
jgi:protein-S-isoprenylcysteine O-methyltransferase Ste14